MATRSNIGMWNSETKEYTYIYCHWDGYIENNGKILLEHYKDPVKVAQLLALGNLSSLGNLVEPTSEDHDFNHPQQNVCVFYGRDRGEKDQGARTIALDNVSQVPLYEEYTYVMINGQWFVLDDDLCSDLTPLDLALDLLAANEEEEE